MINMVKDDKHAAVIAQNIKKYLRESQMLQKDLAAKIGIAPSTVTDYLKLRSRPSHGVIQQMADIFGVEKSDIDTTYKLENPTALERLLSEATSFEEFSIEADDRIALFRLIHTYFESKEIKK